MDNISPKDLKIFLEAARLQSMSEAARYCGLTQPAISQAISRLEMASGTKLLIRTKKGVSLTRPGNELYAKGESLTRVWQDTLEHIRGQQQTIRGVYSIGVHHDMAVHTLDKILPRILNEARQLSVEMYSYSSRIVTSKVINLELDFGIVANPIQSPDLVIKKLCKSRLYLYTRLNPTELQDPSREDSVLFCNQEIQQSKSILKAALKKKILKSRRIIHSEHFSSLVRFVEAGAGMAILPELMVNTYAKTNLCKVKNSPHFEDTISFIYRRDAQQHLASRFIRRICIESF